MKGHRISDERKAEALELFSKDHDVRNIAKKFRVKPKTVQRWASEAGVDATHAFIPIKHSIAEAVAKSTAKDSPMHEVIALLRQARKSAEQGRLKKSVALAQLALCELEGT